MSVTLDHLLMLAGRLDDARGFDAPRERFRRFLLEHVLDVGSARSFIEQCHHALDEQHVRALEDLVVLLGRFAGFEVAFGAPIQSPDGFAYRGVWQSRLRIHVVIDVRSALSTSESAAGLVRSVAALRETPPSPGLRTIGLSVLTPLSASRAKVEEAIAAANASFPVGIVRLSELMSLVEMVNRGQVIHADMVKVLDSTLPLDFVVNFVDRLSVSVTTHASEPVTAAPPLPSTQHPALSTQHLDRERPSYWMASVGPDQATSPEEFLQLVVGKRHVFGVTDRGTVVGTVREGDWICFHLPGKGIVGHAQVASVTDSGIRDARRYRQVLRLDDLDLHLDRPIPPDSEAELRMRAAPATANRSAQILVEISQDSFKAIRALRASWETGRTVERLSG